jgi:polysaccharide export outer membrane protein
MKKEILACFTMILLLVTSCGSKKNIVYFQDEALEEGGVLFSQPKELIYKPDDILTINVSALDPDAVLPFNLTVPSSNVRNVLDIQSQQQLQTYLIDYDGNIEFPCA